MMRFVTSQIRRTALALGICLGLCAPAGAQSDEPGTALTLPQARNLAAYALRNNQPGLTLRLTAGLLRANPRDGVAHYLRAAAYAWINRPGQGRRSAARAYRFADHSDDKLRAAQMAARLSVAENRPTLAQLWLRRTAIHTDDAIDERRLAQDFQTLRRINPWYFSFRTGLRPSNNVNNGADSAANVIDGVPDGGTLPPSALALSGMIGTLDLSASYRLRTNATSATYLASRLYVQRVALSDGSKARAPGVENSDLNSEYLEFSLNHQFAVGPPDAGGTAGANFTIGESHYGGQRNYRLARIGAERSWRLGPDASLRLDGSVEKRFKARFLSNDAHVLQIGAAYSQKLPGGSSFGLSLGVRDTDAAVPNGTFTSASLRASYALGKRLGPAKVSAAIGLGYSDYPSYTASLRVPLTQREDTSVYGDLTFFFEDLDYAGFAPTLRLRAGRKSSNFSQFTTRELSVSLGIQSKF